MSKLRWGILSTGNIAEKFAQGLAALDDAALVAVGSRTQESADAFGEKYNVPHRYASYEALANDPEVDAIYVATPHTFHAENTLLCLRANKAVLCEKPFSLNAAQTEAMIGEARERGVFLMEAMWTRFLPHMVRLRELLQQGVIGEVRMLTANFGFRAEFNPTNRLFDPALGGGALLDVGIYPVSLASMIFGSPRTIVSQATLAPTGVDEQTAMVFGYEHGQLAVLSCASRTNTTNEAWIYGTEGMIRIEPEWWHFSSLAVQRQGKAEERMTFDPIGNGYNYEAAEVARCLAENKLESDIMTLDETQSLTQTLDTIRAQWGLRYPGE